MDGILALLALVVLAIPISIIALFVGQSSLRRRLDAAERELARLRTRPAPQPDASAGTEAAPMAALPEAEIGEAVAPDAVAPDTGPAEPTAPPRAPLPWERARGAAARASDETIRVPETPAPPPEPRGPSAGDRLFAWLRENWVYAVAAASLALAGIFFVQYGIENGLLPPTARVAAALIFGLALVGAGEWLRRRHGDGEEVSTAYLPSVFSGAGIVSVFAAIVAARQLYGLIGAETAFGGLMVTAAGAVALGWFSGPLLVVVGLVGAALTPFVVGGSGAGPWLYAHYALIGAVGLAVDKVRGWRWLSVLALVLAYLGAWPMLASGAGVPGLLVFLALMPVLTVVLTGFALIPTHAGPSLTESLLARGAVRPNVAVRLAHGAMLVSTLGLMAQEGTAAEAMLAFALLAGLAVLVLLWADRAEGLGDLALWPALGLLGRLVAEVGSWGGLYDAFRADEIGLRAPEVPPSGTATILLAMAALVSAAAAFRAFRAGPGPMRLGFSLAAVLVAPLAAAALELFWMPALVLGTYPWALHVIALAAAMTLLALRFARVDGEDRRRAAHATLSALSLIALALFLVTTKTALTLALAVLALVAASLDRRFRLPEMGLFVQIAVAVLTYRLLADPGLDWAWDAPVVQVVLAFGGTLAALVAAWITLRPMERLITLGVLESAVAGLGVVFANVLITRWLMWLEGDAVLAGHWALGVQLLPWLVLAAVQLYRAGLGGPLRLWRLNFAALAGVVALGLIGALLTVANPLFQTWPDIALAVRGPQPFDTLLVAYGIPGLILVLAGLRLRPLAEWPPLRLGVLALGAALLGWWVAMEIRRFWQGDWLGVPGVVQEELYSYTVAMLLLGAGLLYQAIARRSLALQRVAMAVIGLTAAKVFLIDASGLTGLTRVLSFLGLGLSLAALAWLNRWAGQAARRAGD